MPARHPAFLVRAGSASVQIFGRGPYTIAWRESAGGKRHRRKRAKFKAAKEYAEKIAINLANGQVAQNSFTESDRAGWRRCTELAGAIKVAPELLIAEAIECRKILSGHCAPPEACRAWMRQHPAGVEEKISGEILTEYFTKNPVSTKAQKNRKTMLERFVKRFPGPLTILVARDIDVWLDDLKVGLRTRRNHRDALSSFLTWSRFRNYLAKDFDPLDGVSDPDPETPHKAFYQVDELVQLLNFAETTKAGRKLIPFMCLGSFAGIRHEEIRRLDWSHFDWELKRIKVRSTVSKVKEIRIVDMSDELIEWLQPYRRPAGPVCVLKNTSNALCRLRKRAGIKGKKRNAFRKTYLKDQVARTQDPEAAAYQAGTSTQMLDEYYVESDTTDREDANRRRAIRPTRADVLPLWQHAAALAK